MEPTTFRRPNIAVFLKFLIISLVTYANIHAQGTNIEIDKLFSWATPATPGCVCAVSQNGKILVNNAYGAADLERKILLTPNLRFDAGSVTKQFVAAATLLLVEEGRLSLSDDIHKYLPELPDYGYKITLDHLLTHTSGLRDWTAIRMLSAKDEDALTMALRQHSLNFVPGEEWAYSNTNYVLLKEIISRTTGMSFGQFAQKRLFDPLKMQSTSYREDLREPINNRALAYEKEGNSWKLDVLLDNDRGGGGGLLTTAGDLLLWNDALTHSRLGTFITNKIQEPARLNNGRQLGYARGLFLDDYPRRVIWHTGSAGAYKSLLARFPEQGLSIAILCNGGESTDRMEYGRRIFDIFAPGIRDAEGRGEEAQISVEAGADVSATDLANRSGLYFNEQTGQPLRLVVEDGWLRIAAGPRLVAENKEHYKRLGAALEFMSQDAFTIHFLSQDRFELRSMEGKVTSYTRAEIYKPAAEDLKAFEGEYKSDDIAAIFEVTAGKLGLVMRLKHAPGKSLDFKPVHRDTFQWNRMLIRFLKDKSGNITALEYSNPLLNNVTFTKI